MHRGDADDRVSGAGLNENAPDAAFDDFSVGLVLEGGHRGPPRRVVPNRAEKQNDGSGGRIGDEGDELCGVDRCLGYRHVVAVG